MGRMKVVRVGMVKVVRVGMVRVVRVGTVRVACMGPVKVVRMVGGRHGAAARRCWRVLAGCTALVVCLAGAGAAASPRTPVASGPVGATDSPVPPAGRTAWMWPLGGPSSILRPFDPPAQRWLSGHRGVDLAAATGGAVRSPAAGKVAFTGTVVDRPVVTVDHGGGLVSSFEPATSALPVGAAVSRGQRLAVVGAGGHCSGQCVHWGLRLDGEYIDPLNAIVDRRPSMLLPIP